MMTLREVVDRYAWHLPECPAYYCWPDEADDGSGAFAADATRPLGRCTCGFRQVLKGLA